MNKDTAVKISIPYYAFKLYACDCNNYCLLYKLRLAIYSITELTT